MDHLLSRYAEAIFWMARYVERAENLARVLDVHETYSRDSRGGQNWAAIVQLYADEEDFYKRHETATAVTVLHYYLLDPDHLGSIFATVRAARENARTLRPLISTEMWMQLNVFSNWMRGLRQEDVAEGRLARFCGQVKEACQTHTGITEGTFYRDEGWYFYQMGRMLERADQTTRLLDVKYHLLLPRVEDVGSYLDASQWNALLRSAAGYHAFRRVYPSGLSAAHVGEFLLFNPAFPRSVACCVRELETLQNTLRSRYRLRGGAEALERLDELRASLDEQGIDEVLERGLHEYLDWIQLRLIDIGRSIGRDFFGQPPEEPAEALASA